MIKVIGVRFRTAGKIYFFDPLSFELKKGDHVIVETARGIEYGVVKLYLMSSGFGSFVGQSVQTMDRDGKTIKYIDYHINKSGTYEFCVELFNPQIGNSVWGGGKRGTGYYDYYTIEVAVDENGKYCSPYLTDELGNILTDENGNRIIL